MRRVTTDRRGRRRSGRSRFDRAVPAHHGRDRLPRAPSAGSGAVSRRASGRVPAPGGETRESSTASFSTEPEGDAAPWTDFVTIRTTPYEHWIRGVRERSSTGTRPIIWYANGDLSSGLKQKPTRCGRAVALGGSDPARGGFRDPRGRSRKAVRRTRRRTAFVRAVDPLLRREQPQRRRQHGEQRAFMMDLPATRPDAMGTLNVSRSSCGRGPHPRDRAPIVNASALLKNTTQPRPRAHGGRQPLLRLWEALFLEHGQQHADQRTDQEWPSAPTPGRLSMLFDSTRATGFPTRVVGSGNFSERRVVRDHQVTAGNDRERAEEDADELRDELLARVCAEQVAALEVWRSRSAEPRRCSRRRRPT